MSKRDTESRDSGGGQSPGPSMGEFMKAYFEDQRARDEKESKRRENERKERAEEELRREEVEKSRRERERTEREEEVQRREEAEKARRETEARNNLELQQQLIQTIMDRRAVPVHASPTPSFDLPRMKDSDELEEFVSVFETALKVNEVPRGLWKQKLVTHLPLKALARVDNTLQLDGSSYGDVISALRGSNAMSFCSAATCAPV